MTRTQLLIGSIFYLCSTLASKETVKVTLYYETLCPYSIDFINNQLYPGYQKLGDVITLDLIPFGKAKIKNTHGKIKISCQHGRKECYGNKIHACAIQNNTQDVWMNFIGCDMATDHPTNKRFIQKFTLLGMVFSPVLCLSSLVLSYFSNRRQKANRKPQR